MSLRSLLAIFAFGVGLSGCTAARVLTHTVSHAPIDAPKGRYALDPDHASLRFDVDHLGFSRFSGRFNDLVATLDFTPNEPNQSRIRTVISTASLDTPVEELDMLLKGAGMFDAERYPEIRFESVDILPAATSQAAPTGQVIGNFSMRGVTRPVTLNVTYNGGAKNPLTQKYTLGFSATGAFSRSSFGLGKWAPAVGDEVRVHIEAEFVLQNTGAKSD